MLQPSFKTTPPPLHTHNSLLSNWWRKEKEKKWERERGERQTDRETQRQTSRDAQSTKRKKLGVSERETETDNGRQTETVKDKPEIKRQTAVPSSQKNSLLLIDNHVTDEVITFLQLHCVGLGPHVPQLQPQHNAVTLTTTNTKLASRSSSLSDEGWWADSYEKIR